MLDRRVDVGLEADLRPADVQEAVVHVDGEERGEIVGHAGHGGGGKLHVGGAVAGGDGWRRTRVGGKSRLRVT